MARRIRDTRRAHYVHRMHYSTQERVVGLFVLIGFGILLSLLFATGKTERLFEDRIAFYGIVQNAEGVKTGTSVKISGITVGEVTEINISSRNEIVVTMEILSRFHNLLREDSHAKLGKLSFLGQSSIDITAGDPAKPVLSRGSTLGIEELPSLDEVIAKATPVLETILVTIDNISKIIEAIDAQKIAHSVDNLSSISEELKQAAQQINSKKGLASALLYDEVLEADLKTMVAALRDTSQQVNSLVSTIGTGNGASPKFTSRLHLMVKDLERTLEGVQRIWPISAAVTPKPQSPMLLPPSGAHH